MALDHPVRVHYEPLPDTRDEMLDRAGNVRASWYDVHDHLAALGPDGIARHDQRIRRLLHGHGTTFQINAEGDNQWGLDPVPVVLTRAEFDHLARGIAQRAHLLDAVLADLYGPRRLLLERVLPADAVLRSADYLQGLVGFAPPGGRHLLFHTADVARDEHGTFCVLGDRTEGPSGAGYALENREVMARSFPDLLRRTGARRIVDWFETVHETLSRLAPAGVEDPRIVLYTAGPTSRTYFEHSFLARSLGYSLVEDGDLTVRRGHVFLKAVTGLEPVHVILRRVTSGDADPLELGTSGLGVAGLSEAVRRGTVTVANPLGTGIASSPALLPFLDDLCRRLLGEDPVLATVPSLWCGEPAARQHVVANLDRMVLRAVHRPAGSGSRFGSLLAAAERDALVREIEADPALWVAQEEVALSTTPALAIGGDGGSWLAPRYALLRTFAVAAQDTYAVMEGALARAAPERNRITIFEGGTSKDTWVTDPASPRLHGAPRARLLPQVDLRSSVTSRVAESMLWVGRNLERATTSIRVVNSVNRYLDQWPELAEEADGLWTDTVHAAVEAVVGATAPLHETDDTAQLLHAALVDLHRPRSLATSLRFLLLGVRTVRELFSTDSWRLLTELDDLRAPVTESGPDRVDELTAQIMTPLAALSGLLTESMVRDPGWLFLDAGRRIERAQLVSSFLRTTMVTPVSGWIEAPLQEMVLSTWESLVAYRRRHRSDIEAPALLSLLVLDASNPRSVLASLDSLRGDLAQLPATGSPTGELAVADDLHARLLASDPMALAAVGPGGRRDDLDDRLAEVVDSLDAVIEGLTHRFFTHVRATPLVAHRGRGPAEVAPT